MERSLPPLLYHGTDQTQLRALYEEMTAAWETLHVGMQRASVSAVVNILYIYKLYKLLYIIKWHYLRKDLQAWLCSFIALILINVNFCRSII